MSKVVFSYIRNSLHMPWVKLDMIIDDLETLFFILFWPGLLMYTAEHLSDRCEASIVKSGHFFNMEQLSGHRVFDRVPYYGPYTIEIPQIKSFVWKMWTKIEKEINNFNHNHEQNVPTYFHENIRLMPFFCKTELRSFAKSINSMKIKSFYCFSKDLFSENLYWKCL